MLMMKRETENKRVISLMYHDVVAHATHQASGFGGADAARYKLEPTAFAQHLAAIKAAVSTHPILVTDFVEAAKPWMLTFDDGGASADTPIAEHLEALGWRAHFFITTDYIGAPAFLNRAQIRALHQRGHVIGSHSCSHPLRFAARPWSELQREWRESVAVLADLLGEPVQIASIPGGQYARAVAEAAAAAGIKALFTSEPTTACTEVDGCFVLGRYAIQRGTAAAVAAAIASGQRLPRYQQWLWWEAKKITKRLGGEGYLRWRKTWLEWRRS